MADPIKDNDPLVTDPPQDPTGGEPTPGEPGPIPADPPVDSSIDLSL